jgi:hypothetical protein
MLKRFANWLIRIWWEEFYREETYDEWLDRQW